MRIEKKTPFHDNSEFSDEGTPLTASIVDLIKKYVESYRLDEEVSKNIVMKASIHLDTLIRQACNNQEFSEEFDDAKYWKEEFSRISDAKHIIDSELQKECNQLKHSNLQLQVSRDNWKNKYDEVEKSLQSLSQQLPDNVTWPRIANSKIILPGDWLKVKSELVPENTEIKGFVDSIKFSSGVNDSIRCVICLCGGEYYESDLEIPEIDSFDSLIRELKPNASPAFIQFMKSRFSMCEDIDVKSLDEKTD